MLGATCDIVRAVYTVSCFQERQEGTGSTSEFYIFSLTPQQAGLLPSTHLNRSWLMWDIYNSSETSCLTHRVEFTTEAPRYNIRKPRQKWQTPVFMLCHTASFSWLPVSSGSGIGLLLYARLFLLWLFILTSTAELSLGGLPCRECCPHSCVMALEPHFSDCPLPSAPLQSQLLERR